MRLRAVDEGAGIHGEVNEFTGIRKNAARGCRPGRMEAGGVEFDVLRTGASLAAVTLTVLASTA